MTYHVLKSKIINYDSELFMMAIGTSHLNLGFQVNYWGIRLMLIWWHVCIHY